MNYQTLILSEHGLKQILSMATALSTEDKLEIRRALQVLADERTLKSNQVKEVPMPKGTWSPKRI
jgi:hypothetical protein